MIDTNDGIGVSDSRLDGVRLEQAGHNLWIVSKVCRTSGRMEYRTLVSGEVLNSLGLSSSVNRSRLN